MNKKKTSFKLPAWFEGCQPEYLTALWSSVGLTAVADVMLAADDLVSGLSGLIGMFFTEAA